MSKTGIDKNESTSSRVRGPYKKHKEGFKIAVDFKLNTTQKPQYSWEHETDGLFPLYIEVRAKRQRAYFRSQHPFSVAPDKFEHFKQNPIIASLLAQESKLVSEHLANYVAQIEGELNINDWYGSYRFLNKKRTFPEILVGFITSEFRSLVSRGKIDQVDLFNVVQEPMEIRAVFALASILTKLGIEGFEEILSAINHYNAVKDFLYRHSHEWFDEQLQIDLNLHDSLSVDILLFNELMNEKIQRSSSEYSDDISAHLEALKEIYKRYIENV